MTEIITFSVSAELRQKIDKLRGDIARSKFISRTLENAIKMNMVEERNKDLARGQKGSRPRPSTQSQPKPDEVLVAEHSLGGVTDEVR